MIIILKINKSKKYTFKNSLKIFEPFQIPGYDKKKTFQHEIKTEHYIDVIRKFPARN